MNVNKVSLSALRVFVEVAACQSFTEAAQRLFRTQPALSRQVAELERELGLALFVRQGRGLALTPAGHDLVRRARAVLDGVESLVGRAHDMARGRTGLLRVGATAMLFDSMMPRLLRRFADQWPDVRLDVSEVDSVRVIEQVEARELDVALTRYALTDNVVGERLFPMVLIAIVDRRHPLARRRRLDMAELQDWPLLMMVKGIGSRVLVDQACRQGGYTLPDIRFESRSYGSLVEMAMAGHGVAVVSSVATLRHADARVIPIRHRNQPLSSWAAVHWHEQAEQPPYMRSFIELARDLGLSDYPGRQYDLGL